ncbi:MAG: orotidine-5'-phosphate decarboxylase [Lentisphaeria bacterium]|nr:orotidine-5'-phosphate decarboxylase [Lentisphaeria bacterium]
MAERSTQLIVALDMDAPQDALRLVRRLGPSVDWYKVGNQLFTRHGPETVRALKGMGKQVFLDLKFHDIPNTVAHAVGSAAAIGADMTNVHAGGGPAMLAEAARAGREAGILVIAVTVLTSMGPADIQAVGVHDTPEAQVLRLASLARDCGLPGVVCSALEIGPVRRACGNGFVLVVPGIRPAGAAAGDQVRIMTPGGARAAGATFVVVGRPVYAAADPEATARTIREELDGKG